MGIVLAVLGAALVVAAIGDALWTTLWLEGHAGPIVRRVSSGVRSLVRRVVGVRAGAVADQDHHRRLSLTGPIVLVAIVVLWVLILAAGWVLVFSASPASLVDGHTHATSTLTERIYYVGGSMLTLGGGHLVARSGAAQIATTLCGMTGLVLVTLTVTYLLSIVEAVVARRAFAGQVHALGTCAEEFVANAWDGRGFPAIEVQLVSLSEQLSLVTEQAAAYPMLHYYHAADAHRSAAPSVALLDDALAILDHGVSPEVRPAPSALRVARAGVHGYLETLRSAYIEPSDRVPPAPALARVRAAGVPTVADAEFAASLAGDEERRRLLLSLVEHEARAWPRRSPGA